MDIETEQEHAPKVLLGSAVTRLLRIRSLYYELVAVAILGFAGTGIPLFGSLYYQRVWHLGVAHRADVLSIIGLSSFLGSAGRLPRRRPALPARPREASRRGGLSPSPYSAGLYSVSLYMPHLWMVVVLQFLAQAAVAPLSICIFQTLAATAPPEMRAICFGLFGVYALVFGGFAGGILLGAISDATNVTTALTFIGPVCAVGGVLLFVGSRFVRGDITLVIEDVLERYAEGKRRKAGGAIPALQIHNMDFYYGTQQVLFDVNLEIPEGDIVALLGTNGAGKSTLLRAVAGLDHPHRGVIRDLRNQLHLSRVRADHRSRRGPARGGEDDVPGPHRPREPAHRRAHVPPRHRRGPRPPWTKPWRCSPSSRTVSTSRRARCRAASSRCWPWPGS